MSGVDEIDQVRVPKKVKLQVGFEGNRPDLSSTKNKFACLVCWKMRCKRCKTVF